MCLCVSTDEDDVDDEIYGEKSVYSGPREAGGVSWWWWWNGCGIPYSRRGYGGRGRWLNGVYYNIQSWCYSNYVRHNYIIIRLYTSYVVYRRWLARVIGGAENTSYLSFFFFFQFLFRRVRVSRQYGTGGDIIVAYTRMPSRMYTRTHARTRVQRKI